MPAALLTLVLALVPLPVHPAIWPDRPDGTEHFVTDDADLLTSEDLAEVNGMCRKLLEEQGVPVLVVTLPTLLVFGGGGVESFAHRLFDHWGIGSAEQSRGMLLVVAVYERKARIELGEGWGRGHDDDADRIMHGILIPHFKDREFSTGVREAVRGLDALARGQPLPAGKSGMDPALMVFLGFAGLAVLGVVVTLLKSPARRYRRGVRRRRGRRIPGRIGGRRYRSWRSAQSARDRRNAVYTGGGGGLFGGGGGGSFGGGSSGGGGSTGGW